MKNPKRYSTKLNIDPQLIKVSSILDENSAQKRIPQSHDFSLKNQTAGAYVSGIIPHENSYTIRLSDSVSCQQMIEDLQDKRIFSYIP